MTQQEQQEKEERQKMKLEAHLYCTIKVATYNDLDAQVCVGGGLGRGLGKGLASRFLYLWVGS